MTSTYVNHFYRTKGFPRGVGCSKSAFNLISVPDPNMHHCMMGLITSLDGSYIDLPESFPDGDNGLWKFLRNNPQIVYNNIVIEQPDSYCGMMNFALIMDNYEAANAMIHVENFQ